MEAKEDEMEKTILVAIDGSVFSGHSLDYLTKMFVSDHSLAIHLLSVVSSGGGGKDWMFDVDPHRTHSPESEKKARLARKHLKDALTQTCRACSDEGCLDCTCEEPKERTAEK